MIKAEAFMTGIFSNFPLLQLSLVSGKVEKAKCSISER